jgi:transcriptional regulator with XRE-family HTH domain
MLRAIRVRKGWRQSDLAARARVSTSVVGRLERGEAASLPLGTLRRIASALGARLDAMVRWNGADLPRLLDVRHSAMHEAVADMFAALDGWVVEPEVSFSVYGERGVIDVLAWHPVRRMLLVIELKTEIVEIGVLLGKMDQRRRLAADLARRAFGWDALAVSTWVLVAEGGTNRRTLARHREVLRAKFPIDGRTMRRWLGDPTTRVDALGFLPYRHHATLRRDMRPVRRVVVAGSRSTPPS